MNSIKFLYAAYIATWLTHGFYLVSLVSRYTRWRQMKVAQSSGVYVQNHLVFAILVTILCCLPAGVPAILYAAQVNGKLQAGDIAGARTASKKAKMWCWISVGASLAGGLVYLLIAVGVAGSTSR
jgi:hypothetical protein